MCLLAAMAAYEPTEEEVSRSAWAWFPMADVGSVQARAAARGYLLFLADNRLMVESIHVSAQRFCGLAAGCLVLESCPGVAVAKGDNALDMYNRRVVQTPYWMSYELWWYPGMVAGNFRDLHTDSYQGEKIGVLGTYVDRHQGTAWRHEYEGMSWSDLVAGLRRFLTKECGPPYWLECSAGYSYAGYRCLDWYERVVTPIMHPVPRMARWHVLGADVPWRDRDLPDVFAWWLARNATYRGQRELGDEEVVPPAPALERMMRLARQLRPGVPSGGVYGPAGPSLGGPAAYAPRGAAAVPYAPGRVRPHGVSNAAL